MIKDPFLLDMKVHAEIKLLSENKQRTLSKHLSGNCIIFNDNIVNFEGFRIPVLWQNHSVHKVSRTVTRVIFDNSLN